MSQFATLNYDEEAIIINIVQRSMNKSIVAKYKPYKGYTVNITKNTSKIYRE